MRILISSALALASLLAVPLLLAADPVAPGEVAAASAARKPAALPPRREPREIRSFEALLALTALQAKAKQSGRPPP